MDEHLHSDKHQKHTHSKLQIAEPVGYGCQQEEHGTQAEDGEDVGEEHHIRVERHGEYRRNAVEGKDEVAELYYEHRDE